MKWLHHEIPWPRTQPNFKADAVPPHSSSLGTSDGAENQRLHLQSAGTAFPAPSSGSRSCWERGKPVWLFASGSPRARTGVPSPGKMGAPGWKEKELGKLPEKRPQHRQKGSCSQPGRKASPSPEHLAAQASRPGIKSHKLFLHCRDGEFSCPPNLLPSSRVVNFPWSRERASS